MSGATWGASTSASSADEASATTTMPSPAIAFATAERTSGWSSTTITRISGLRRGHPCSAAASDVDAENGAVRMTSVPVSTEEAIRSLPPMSAARSRIDARP